MEKRAGIGWFFILSFSVLITPALAQDGPEGPDSRGEDVPFQGRAFSDADIHAFILGTLDDRTAAEFADRLEADRRFRQRTIRQRKFLNTSHPIASRKATQLLSDIVDFIREGNKYLPGGPLDPDFKNEFQKGRERLYQIASDLCGDLLKTGELQDLALENQHVIENNVKFGRTVQKIPASAPEAPSLSGAFEAAFKGITDGSEIRLEPVDLRFLRSPSAANLRAPTNTDVFPTMIDKTSRKILENAGVKFGNLVEGDASFRNVELPIGWKKVPTDDPKISELVDDEGRRRAGIYLDGRYGFVHVGTRFRVKFDYSRLATEDVVVCSVTDGKRALFTTEPVVVAGYAETASAQTKATKDAEDWLKKYFPEWRDPQAYWTERESDVFGAIEDKKAAEASARQGVVLSELDRIREREALAEMPPEERARVSRLREVGKSMKDAIRRAIKK